jgi:hypothetical protein
MSTFGEVLSGQQAMQDVYMRQQEGQRQAQMQQFLMAKQQEDAQRATQMQQFNMNRATSNDQNDLQQQQFTNQRLQKADSLEETARQAAERGDQAALKYLQGMRTPGAPLQGPTQTGQSLDQVRPSPMQLGMNPQEMSLDSVAQSMVKQNPALANDPKALFGALERFKPVFDEASKLRLEKARGQFAKFDLQGAAYKSVIDAGGTEAEALQAGINAKRRSADEEGLVAAAKKEGSTRGQRGRDSEQLGTIITDMRGNFNKLSAAGAIVDETKPATDNILTSLRTTGVGQAVGKMAGTPEQGLRKQIDSAKPQLLLKLMSASGASARSLDSDNELKTWLGTVGDTQSSLQANLAMLDRIEKMSQLTDNAPAANVAPPGGKLIGTSGGKAVYQLPDGSHVLEQ